MDGRVPLGELARRAGARIVGDPGRRIRGVATLERAGPEDLAFLANPRYRKAAETTRAGAILVPPTAELPGRDLLVAEAPHLALAAILEIFHPETHPTPGVSPDARLGRDLRLGRGVHVGPFAVIGDRTVVGDDVSIGAGSVVGEDCALGRGTRLHPRVVLYRGTRLGERCVVHAGAVLGADGFGFATSPEGHRKIPQVGGVRVGDEVEIGANSAIDRGALDDTVVGDGTKIDDLVMIAHGVRLGPRALLAAQAGIAGSTRIGAGAMFAGQSGAAGHLTLGDGVIVAAKTAVLEDLPDGAFVAGIPAVDHRVWKRAQAALRDLPRLRSELRALRRRVEEIDAGRPVDPTEGG